MKQSIELDVSKYYFASNNDQNELNRVKVVLCCMITFTLLNSHDHEFIDVYDVGHCLFNIFWLILKVKGKNKNTSNEAIEYVPALSDRLLQDWNSHNILQKYSRMQTSIYVIFITN